MDVLRRTLAAGQQRDDAEREDAPPTTIRTKLVMFAVTFLSAIVGTVVLQAFRRGRRRLRSC